MSAMEQIQRFHRIAIILTYDNCCVCNQKWRSYFADFYFYVSYQNAEYHFHFWEIVRPQETNIFFLNDIELKNLFCTILFCNNMTFSLSSR